MTTSNLFKSLRLLVLLTTATPFLALSQNQTVRPQSENTPAQPKIQISKSDKKSAMDLMTNQKTTPIEQQTFQKKQQTQKTKFFFGGTGVDGGGGNAVVCRDSNQKIKSAILLDLVEAEKIYKLKLLPDDPNKTYLELALEAAARIDKGGAGADVTSYSTTAVNGKITRFSFGIMPSNSNYTVQNGVQSVEENINFIPDMGLNPIDDSNSLIRPRGCQIEQVAIYLDASHEVHVVEEIWNAFDKVNKAALLVHESFYKTMRTAEEINSDRTRIAVGHAFAGNNFVNVLDGVPEDVIICGTDEQSPKFRFAVYQKENDKFATVQFFWLNGKVMLSKTTVRLSSSLLPIANSPSRDGGDTMFIGIDESLMDKKLTLAFSKDTKDNLSQYSIGLVIGRVNINELTKFSCNRTYFHCDNKGCMSRESY